METAIARRQGLIVETARAGRALRQRAIPANGPMAIRLKVGQFVHTGPRSFAVKLRWHVDEPIPAGWLPFFHFVDSKKGGREIEFQAVGQLPAVATALRGTSETVARFTVPGEYKAGQSVELRDGIYRPQDGQRLKLSGVEDDQHRIRLGTIRLEGSANDITAVTWNKQPLLPDPRWSG